VSDPRPFLFSLEQIGIKLGLEQIRTLVEVLGHPERAFRSVIVAGTNGKGSVAAMVERGLRSAGYRTGRYTSPHLVNIEERFALDGVPVPPDLFDAAAARVVAATNRLEFPPSFFEATTAVAFEIFRAAQVDVAVLEVGLGGRLDATNVVCPVAAAITAVDFDHEEFLGNTLTAIAREKAGVIKPGIVVILGDNRPEVREVVEEASRAQAAMLVHAGGDVRVSATVEATGTTIDVHTPVREYAGVRLALRGRHQIQNAVTALRLLELLDLHTGLSVTAPAIRTALEEVVWPGRLESMRLGETPVVIDGAHNPAGARALASFLLETRQAPCPMVIGIMRDKNQAAMIAAFARAASRFIFTRVASSRSADPLHLASVSALHAKDVPVEIEPDSLIAVARATAAGTPVVVAGSLYLAGEIRRRLA
jgi:dihydrofolate synthase/folylpolyglutamate synthase